MDYVGMWLKAGDVTNVDLSHERRVDNAAGAQGAAVEGWGGRPRTTPDLR